jgi:hypothetical protein
MNNSQATKVMNPFIPKVQQLYERKIVGRQGFSNEISNSRTITVMNPHTTKIQQQYHDSKNAESLVK